MRAIRRRMAQVAKESPGAVTTPKLQLGGIFAPSPAQKAASRRVSFDSFDRDRGRMVSPAVWAELVSAEQAIIAEAQASAQRGIDAVLAAGYTIQDMQDLWLDPVEGRPVRAAFGAAKAGWSEKAFEFRYASILSGPRTHVKNNAGNAANFLVEGVFQPTMEGLVNALMRDPSQASLDEGLTFLRGAKRTMRTAVSNAWLAWRGEMPVLEVGLKEQGVNIGAYTSRADALEADRISPAVGNRVLGVGLRRMSLSLLLAADEFWKTLAVGGQSLALAGRIARSEGLHGAAKDRRISALLADKTHPLWIEAVDKARKITFQDEGGRASQAITNAAYSVRSALDTATPYLFVGTTLLPFVSTSVRVAANALRRSPLSMALWASRVVRGKYRGEEGRAAFVMDTADAAMAGLIAGTVWAMMGDDEDGMPSITGSRPQNRGESEMMQRLGIPTLSVRVGDRWHSFKDIEPLSTSLGLIVDGLAEFQRTGSLGAAQAVLQSALQQTQDKTFLQTLGDLWQLAQGDRNPAGKAADMLSYSFITPWMPNLIRQPLRALDDNTRARVRKQDGESIFTTTAKDLPYQLLPLEAIAPAPKFDLWGRPMLKEATQTPSSAVVRLLSPTLPQGRKGEQMKADLFLRKYNERVRAGELGDEDVAFPLSPSYTFEMDGEVKRWSNDEYAELTQRAGEIAARGVTELIDQGSLSLEEPTTEQLRVVQRVISAARRGVAGELKVRRQEKGPALRTGP